MRLLRWLLTACIVVAPISAQSQPSGVFAIWPGHVTSDLTLPHVSGGQVMVQWRDIEPDAPGEFDWEPVERQLGRISAAGLTATIQVNARRHPNWLVDSVPRLTPAQLADRALATIAGKTDNPAGMPMYWHPAYLSAMQGMVEALAQFVLRSDLRKSVAGIRMNYNAIGTEHWLVPTKVRSADQWNLPAGVEPGTDWTFGTVDAYRRAVEGFYLDAFGYRGSDKPITTVYMRARQDASDDYANMLQGDNRIGVFHTSSEPEPFTLGQEEQYEFFRRFCAAGNRPCYAEPWSAAVNHKQRYNVPPMSAEQWHYWRHLGDLQLGASIVAEYAPDLRAEEPAEAFAKTRAFTSRYAGTLGRPDLAPGGWIAFRDGEYLRGDYEFLIQAENAGQAPGYTDWLPTSANLGEDEDARYGVWSRVIQAGDEIRLHINPTLLASLPEATGVEIRVVAKPADPAAVSTLPIKPPAGLSLATESDAADARDDTASSELGLLLRVTGPSTPILMHLDSTDEGWSELVQPVAALDPSGVDWTLKAENGAVQIHLFELRRASGE
ncbi:hypothetical protein CKO40_17915 [Halochromatium glycolicum]|uniref:Glycoside hydrolase family 42 N-terminal domain-containing protein n=2 Tax=Halochromatium glycolicum TaxID=85075 RepID=A0AAJ0U6S5_9GAMM|nr:hypothetical protein [Halochromatium glycolicum]